MSTYQEILQNEIVVNTTLPTSDGNSDNSNVDLTPFYMIGAIVLALVLCTGLFFYLRRRLRPPPESFKITVESHAARASEVRSSTLISPEDPDSEELQPAAEIEFENAVQTAGGKKANFLGYAEDGAEKVGMLYFSNGEVQVRRLVSFRFMEGQGIQTEPAEQEILEGRDKGTVNLMKSNQSNPNYKYTKNLQPKRLPIQASEDLNSLSSSESEHQYTQIDRQEHLHPIKEAELTILEGSAGRKRAPSESRFRLMDQTQLSEDDTSSELKPFPPVVVQNLDVSEGETSTHSSTPPSKGSRLSALSRNSRKSSVASKSSALTSGTVLFE